MLEVHVHRNAAAMRLELYLRDGRNTVGFIENGAICIREMEQGRLMEPALVAPIEVGDQLVDALLRAGFRQSRADPQHETIAAMRGHISFAESMATKILTLLGDKADDRQQERAGGVGQRTRAAPKEEQ